MELGRILPLLLLLCLILWPYCHCYNCHHFFFRLGSYKITPTLAKSPSPSSPSLVSYQTCTHRLFYFVCVFAWHACICLSAERMKQTDFKGFPNYPYLEPYEPIFRLKVSAGGLAGAGWCLYTAGVLSCDAWFSVASLLPEVLVVVFQRFSYVFFVHFGEVSLMGIHLY